MTNYYLPENYPDTAKGARLYIKDIKASDKEKEQKRLTLKAVKLIIDYNKNGGVQQILNTLENDKDGTILFSIDLWDRFITDVGNKTHKEFKQRERRINSPKRQLTLKPNDKEEYNIKYYLPDAYPDNEEGMREYFSDLIRNAHTDEKAKKELLLFTKVYELIESYHTYKEKKPLQEAIRNESELFNSREFRDFVADINSSEYKPKKSGYKHRATEAKYQTVVAHVEYYHNMGFPIYYESNKQKLNACQLTADRVHLAKASVEEIYKNKDNLNGWTAFIRCTGYNNYDDRLLSFHGKSIWVLNGFRKPETEEKIEQLEKILLSLPTREELRKVENFCWGYNARKTKLPTTNKELKRIKKLLSKHEHYEFLKSLQIREISLKI